MRSRLCLFPALVLTVSSSIASAQTPRTGSEGPSDEHRVERLALGTLTAIGTTGTGVGIATLGLVGVSGVASSGSYTAGFAVVLVSANIANAILTPLAYSIVADACEGRGRYWAAVVGYLLGGGLGSAAIPLVFNGGSVLAPIVLIPVLALAGQSLGYELSTQPRAPRPRARRVGGPMLLPSFAATETSATVSVGGVF